MTSAARQLHLTPAAVSGVVKRVEESLGVRLFDRTTRSVQPTEEGLVLLEGCQDVVERWERALEDTSATTSTPNKRLGGTVHVSAPTDTSYQVVGPVVLTLAKAHPDLQVVVHPTDTLQHMHREAIDIAIRYGELPDSDLAAHHLADYPSILVASPSYTAERGWPTSLDDLSNHQTITLQLSNAPAMSWTLRPRRYGRNQQERQGPDSQHRPVTLRTPLCGDGFLARQWAIQGNGIVLKSLIDVIDDLESDRLHQVLPGVIGPAMPIHAVFPSRRHQPARVRT